MAQKRFITYKAPIESFPLDEKHVGIFKPGRYNGFDTMSTNDNIELTIGHSGSIIKATQDNVGVNNFGALITPTGLVIHEEDSIIVNLPPSTPPSQGQPQTKRFILICEHNYQAVQGGVPASYIIVASDGYGDTEPEIPNPSTQVKLGTIIRDYENNRLTYVKTPTPLLGDMDPFELYNLIQQYIIIPEPQPLPDITQMIMDVVSKNAPRTIVTGKFDLADSVSASSWTGIPYNKYVDINPGHNLENHTIRFKQTRMRDHTAYVDIDIVPNSDADTAWEWGKVRLIGLIMVNEFDSGYPMWDPVEINGPLVQGSGVTRRNTARRFQVQEGSSQRKGQAMSLKLVIQQMDVIQGENTDTNPELFTVDKTSVTVNAVYPYPQTVKISSSGDWTASSNNSSVSVSPSSGKAGDTNVSISVSTATTGTVTFRLTGTTKTLTVRATRGSVTIF